VRSPPEAHRLFDRHRRAAGIERLVHRVDDREDLLARDLAAGAVDLHRFECGVSETDRQSTERHDAAWCLGSLQVVGVLGSDLEVGAR